MHPSYVPIDAGMLRKLYIDQELTTLEIAAQLGCGATTVNRGLQRFRITPAKSLTLGRLAVPDDHFADFVRGCVDGDPANDPQATGCQWVHQ